jgi:hypothetical protein
MSLARLPATPDWQYAIQNVEASRVSISAVVSTIGSNLTGGNVSSFVLSMNPDQRMERPMKMQLKLTTVFAFIALLVTVAVTPAQNFTVDSQQPQKLVAASSTETLRQELDQAGALGFHVLAATTRGNGEVVLLLERDLNAREPLQLKVIATTPTGTFRKEIADAARQGFRVVPSTFLNKPSGALIGNEIVVILERPVKTTRRFEYKLLSTNQTSTLEAEWRAAGREGYKAVGMITRAEVMMLMEREVR